jgi:hypothetical protein
MRDDGSRCSSATSATEPFACAVESAEDRPATVGCRLRATVVPGVSGSHAVRRTFARAGHVRADGPECAIYADPVAIARHGRRGGAAAPTRTVLR